MCGSVSLFSALCTFVASTWISELWRLISHLCSRLLAAFCLSRASALDTFCASWSADQFEILQVGMLNNSHSELKSAVGDRLLLWCVTSTTPATCHQVKQLYLAVPAVEKTHTPFQQDLTVCMCWRHDSAPQPPLLWKNSIWWASRFHNNFISWIDVYQQLHLVVHCRTLCWPSLDRRHSKIYGL